MRFCALKSTKKRVIRGRGGVTATKTGQTGHPYPLGSADGAEAKLHLSNIKRLEKIHEFWVSREKRL